MATTPGNMNLQCLSAIFVLFGGRAGSGLAPIPKCHYTGMVNLSKVAVFDWQFFKKWTLIFTILCLKTKFLGGKINPKN